MELVRIALNHIGLSSYKATQNKERAEQLELLIEQTKPHQPDAAWHPLISAPFRHPPPHPAGRFRPPFGKNVLYAACEKQTAQYEQAFHFMKERVHLPIETETGMRTLFYIATYHHRVFNLKNSKYCDAITDKNDYTASHQFVMDHPKETFILYPSCRDPQHRDNAAILDITHLAKQPKQELLINFFYDNHKKEITWLDDAFRIQWDEVK
jgi:hypothetical protein